MGFLGFRRSPAAIISNNDRNPYGNGFWAIEFDPATFGFNTQRFEIYHIYLQGPAGSSFRMFANQIPYSTAARGDNNEWDPNHPLTMIGGQSLFFYWNSNATPAPLVYVFCQTSAP